MLKFQCIALWFSLTTVLCYLSLFFLTTGSELYPSMCDSPFGVNKSNNSLPLYFIHDVCHV